MRVSSLFSLSLFLSHSLSVFDSPLKNIPTVVESGARYDRLKLPRSKTHREVENGRGDRFPPFPNSRNKTNDPILSDTLTAS